MKNEFRLGRCGDTWHVWPAASVTFWADGISLELNWLNWSLEWDRFKD
jgi:hypothetical protein